MSPLGKGIHAPRAFSPFTTLIFYFLFQKAKQKQKQVSQGRDRAGGLLAHDCWDRLLGSRTEREGIPELLNLPQLGIGQATEPWL